MHVTHLFTECLHIVGDLRSLLSSSYQYSLVAPVAAVFSALIHQISPALTELQRSVVVLTDAQMVALGNLLLPASIMFYTTGLYMNESPFTNLFASASCKKLTAECQSFPQEILNISYVTFSN